MSTLVNQFVNEIFENRFAYTNTLIDLNQSSISDDWVKFQESWNNLHLDTYMGDGGTYRLRRYAVFYWGHDTKTTTLKPHEPHYQSLTYNVLNGGIARHYDQFEQITINCVSFNKIMNFALDVINIFELHAN